MGEINVSREIGALVIRPLNDRVLIQPLENPNETESGLVLPENRTDKYTEMQGTVIAVGTPTHPRKTEAEQLADKIDGFGIYREMDKGLEHNLIDEARDLLRDLVRREPVVKPGDHVLFSYTAGQELTIDDHTYLLMREDDLLAVLETA